MQRWIWKRGSIIGRVRHDSVQNASQRLLKHKTLIHSDYDVKVNRREQVKRRRRRRNWRQEKDRAAVTMTPVSGLPHQPALMCSICHGLCKQCCWAFVAYYNRDIQWVHFTQRSNFWYSVTHLNYKAFRQDFEDKFVQNIKSVRIITVILEEKE